MIEIMKLLTEDQIVKSAIVRNSKLNQHVQFFLHENYRKLDNNTGSNCLTNLSCFLFPALLTYRNIVTNSGDLFHPSTGANENIRDCFILTCREIEKHLPNLSLGCSDSNTKKKREFISSVIEKKARDVLRRSRINFRSFWILAAFYYQTSLDQFTSYLPNPDNFWQLVPYSFETMQKLELIIHGKLHAFMMANKGCNDVAQKFDRHAMPEDVYDSGEGCTISFVQIASKVHLQGDVLNNLARDLFGFSMGIESWENLVFFDKETGCLEYLPYDIASAVLLLKVYSFGFKLLKNNSAGMDIEEYVKMNMLMYIANIHMFLEAIYDRNGVTTTNARHLLSAMRYLKRNSMATLLAQRGSSIWSEKLIC